MPEGIGYGPDARAALETMMAQSSQEAPSVLCRVCQTQIDAETGAPIQEVSPDAIGAVREYLSGSAETEFGGQQLV